MGNITNNHSFSDSNKRIAATLFLWFLNNNGILYRPDGSKRLPENTLVALTLMIAESRSEEKDVMVKVGFVDGSPEKQTNLLDKLEGYLKHIQTDEFKRDYPFANVYIVVSFEEKPDVLITDLLYKCIDWCKDNGALLKIRIGEDYIRLTE